MVTGECIVAAGSFVRPCLGCMGAGCREGRIDELALSLRVCASGGSS